MKKTYLQPATISITHTSARMLCSSATSFPGKEPIPEGDEEEV